MGDEERDDIIDDEDEVSEEESQPRGGGVEASKIVKLLLYVAGAILLVVLVMGISYLVSKNVQESSYEKRQDIIAAPPPEPLSSFELQDFAKTTADALQDHDMVVLENHGLVCVGKNYNKVIQNAGFFELACEIIIKAGDSVKAIPKEDVERLLDLRKDIKTKI